MGLKPKAGPNTGVLPLKFRFGLRGAELVTLTMAGRVAVRGGRIEVLDPAQAASAGRVYAAGLATWAYPGAANAALCDRLKQLAEGSPAAASSASAVPGRAGSRSVTIRTA